MKSNKLILKADSVSKDYGQNRGNFDISFEIYENEAIGIVGENGAGKTTLIRQMMGFIKPDKGSITMFGLDSYKDAARIKQNVGYVPGEINFPDYKSGNEFLHAYGKMLGLTDFSYADEIISRLQLDIRAYPKRMSKGMKQKTAIVTALMLHAPLIILDEPTTGLDPLMREELLKIILEQKQNGSTVFMSSNSVEELERVCDKVIKISNGKIVTIADVNYIKNVDFRDYKIEFTNKTDYSSFIKGRKDITRLQPQFNQVSIRIKKSELNQLFSNLETKKIKFMSYTPYTLTKYFEEESQRSK